MKYSWIFVPLLLGCGSGCSAFFDIILRQMGSRNEKNESFESLSMDVERYFSNFTRFLENTVNDGGQLLTSHMYNFIERPDIPLQSHGNASDRSCDMLIHDIEKFIGYLDNIKEFQLMDLIKSFERIQSFFKSQTEKCELVQYRKGRCVELINSLYKIRFSVFENRLKVYFASVLQYFDAFSRFLFTWLPVKDSESFDFIADNEMFDELSQFIEKIQT